MILSEGKKELFALLALVLGGVLIRGLLLSQVKMVLPDEAYYVGMTLSMVQGREYAGFDPHPFQASEATRGMHQGQPLIPYLFSLASQIGSDPIRTCQWTSIVFSMLTLVVFHLCTQFFCKREESLWSDLIYVLAPFSIQYSLWAMNHALFNLFFILLLFCVFKLQNSRGLRWAILAGLAAWGAYLTRFEVIAFVAFLAAVGIFAPWHNPNLQTAEKKFQSVSTFFLTFIILSLPLWIWIRKSTGMWQLDWTFGYERISQATSSRWHVPLQTQAILLGYEHALLGFHPLFNFLGFYLRNILSVYFILPKMLPLPVWIVMAFGIVEVLSRDSLTRKRTLLTLSFAAFPIFFYPVVVREPRFFFPSLLLLILFVGPGIRFLLDQIRARRLFPRLVCLALLGIIFFPHYRSLLLGFAEEPIEQKQVGEWVQRHYLEPQAFLVTDNRSCFYAGPVCRRRFRLHQVEMGAEKEKGFEKFLQENKIGLVVVDTLNLKKLNTAFHFLLDSAPPYLKRVFEGPQGGGGKIVLYQYDPALEREGRP